MYPPKLAIRKIMLKQGPSVAGLPMSQRHVSTADSPG